MILNISLCCLSPSVLSIMPCFIAVYKSANRNVARIADIGTSGKSLK
jgi:hypothetical protein